MKIYSFDKKNLKKKGEIYDIFEKNIRYSREVTLYFYIVPIEREMRLDLISKDIYGSSDYMEELIVMNHIINPYSIKVGQILNFCPKAQMNSLYTKDEMQVDDSSKQKMIKAAQSKKTKTDIWLKEQIPTTVMPDNLKQVTIDTKNRKIKILNSFK
jgi:hypothetical protein